MSDEKLLKGLDAAAFRIWGKYKRRRGLLRSLRKRAGVIKSQSEDLSVVSSQTLRLKLARMEEAFIRDPILAQGQLSQALAVLSETSARSLGKRPYVVQLMGALALHHGYVAEMSTGEGKTLTVGLAAILAGWSGRPCHILTSNDYLAERDAVELRDLFDMCGLRVESCTQEMKPEQRQNYYAADIVYVTPKTLLADYLRDELARRKLSDISAEQLVLCRGIHTAIVDEADSMLIDESITPLIISATREVSGLHDAVRWASSAIGSLEKHRDYDLDSKARQIDLFIGPENSKLQATNVVPLAWRSAERRIDLINQALQVREFFSEGSQYVVEDGKVVLIDEFTGRLMPERSLSAGLHQAIEAKEKVDLTDPNMPLVQMTFQRFFKRFSRLSCTTGTAQEAADEFWHIYEKAVIRIPTNRPRRVDFVQPLVFPDRKSKHKAIVSKAKELSSKGSPVLIGVRSLSDSLEISDLIGKQGLPHETLNAVNHRKEGAIVSVAGRPGAITIATNMAGRGVDIHLDELVLERGGLSVFISEPNDSSRVDRQLAGRCGRQGNPGCVYQFFSPDDTVFVRNLTRVEHWFLRKLVGFPSIIRSVLVLKLTKMCQRRFERNSYQSRRVLLEKEEWLDAALPFNLVR